MNLRRYEVMHANGSIEDKLTLMDTIIAIRIIYSDMTINGLINMKVGEVKRLDSIGDSYQITRLQDKEIK